MQKSVFIIVIVVAIIIGAGYLLVNNNPEVKALAEKIGIIKKETPETLASYNAVFVIFDPSGSGNSTYSVPRISVSHVDQIISSIKGNGYGDIWLTYISRSALRTEVLHFSIPENVKQIETPVRTSGERKAVFDKRYAQFKNDSTKNATVIAEKLQGYNDAKTVFLNQCADMIEKGYAHKKRWEDYSDIIGSLNAATRSLSTIRYDSTHFRSILLLSDGVQDISASDPKQKLQPISDDVILVTVNHGGSPKSIVTGRSLEVDNIDQGIKQVIRNYKHLNQ